MKNILTGAIFFLVLLQSCSGPSAENEIKLLSVKGQKANCVSFADNNGSPVISWCEADTIGNKHFFFSYFDKEKNMFNERINVPIEKSTSLHAEGMPKLAIKSDGTIVAIYETAAPTAESRFAGFVKYIQSFDKGKTWTAPEYVHTDTTAGESHSFASITRLQDGEIGASWLDVTFGNNKSGRSVMFAKTNGHNGFGKQIIVDSFACQCCRTAISCDVKGNASIMFRDILSDSIRDMSVVTSTDDGQTFSKAVSFTNDDWVINGCPHNGPSVVNDGGNTYAAWFTGGSHSGLYYAALNSEKKLTDRKKISSTGRNIQLCLLPGGNKVVAYNESIKDGKTFFSKIAVDKIAEGKAFTMNVTDEKANASYPVITALTNDKVIVAWIDNDLIYYKILSVDKISTPVLNADVLVAPAMVNLSNVKLDSKKDLSCGMPISAGLEDTAHYKNKVYGFCSKECKEAFLKDPEAALKAAK